jgi:hypothetical protein
MQWRARYIVKKSAKAFFASTPLSPRELHGESTAYRPPTDYIWIRQVEDKMHQKKSEKKRDIWVKRFQ